MNNQQTENARGITWDELAKYMKEKIFLSNEYSFTVSGKSLTIAPKQGNSIFCISWFTQIADTFGIQGYATVENDKLLLRFCK